MQAELLSTQTSPDRHAQDQHRAAPGNACGRTYPGPGAANRQLEALSRTDGLTGIANRRRFDEVLTERMGTLAANGRTLALAMLDIDWFKAYNDRCGHLAGDDCLQSFRRGTGQMQCASTDLVARYGGEEFAIIAPAPRRANAGFGAEIQQALVAGRCTTTAEGGVTPVRALLRIGNGRRTPAAWWPPLTRRCTRPRPRGATGWCWPE